MSWRDDHDPTATKSFLEHLEDLRKTVLWCAVSIGAGMLVCAPLAPQILKLLTLPIVKIGKDPATFLRVFDVTGGVSISLKIIFWAGLLLGMPGVILAIANFVFPGLTSKEKKMVRRSSALAGVLFLAGVTMGYFLTLPVAIKVMIRINAWIGVETEFIQLGDYIKFVLQVLIAFGLAFELPVVVLALGYFGIVSSQTLRAKRDLVIVGILILAAVLTPPDCVSQLLMAVPMWILYEICIVIIRAKEKADATVTGPA